MELQKIRNLSDDELKHHEKTTAEQLFRLRFQVAMGQNDGVKKLRQLRKEIAQVKTVARERELGINGELKEAKAKAAPAAEEKPKRARKTAVKTAAEPKPAAAKKAKADKAKGASK
jgi:large subunit ribosomal protein L29